jgi:hypothetical protein
MLSLISTLGGLLISGLPKLLEFFQDKADKKHELALAEMQTIREKELTAMGFAAQAKVEEIRADQIAMQTDAQMTTAAYEHDTKVLEKAAGWASTYVATVRPTVTYLFVLELIAINLWLTYYLFAHPNLVSTVDDVIKYADIIFSPDEMSMLGGIIGFWFGSRNWSKK